MKTKIYLPAHTPHWFKADHLKYVNEVWLHLFKRIVICFRYNTTKIKLIIAHILMSLPAVSVVIYRVIFTFLSR